MQPPVGLRPQVLLTFTKMMRNFLERVYVATLPYSPNPFRRSNVVKSLGKRPYLSHEEWHALYAESDGISLEFATWFRVMCKEVFGFDLSAAVPGDRLIDDLGMYNATWGDVDWDIDEAFEEEYEISLDKDTTPSVETYGDMLTYLWGVFQASDMQGPSNRIHQAPSGAGDP